MQRARLHANCSTNIRTLTSNDAEGRMFSRYADVAMALQTL